MLWVSVCVSVCSGWVCVCALGGCAGMRMLCTCVCVCVVWVGAGRVEDPQVRHVGNHHKQPA